MKANNNNKRYTVDGLRKRHSIKNKTHWHKLNVMADDDLETVIADNENDQAFDWMQAEWVLPRALPDGIGKRKKNGCLS